MDDELRLQIEKLKTENRLLKKRLEEAGISYDDKPAFKGRYRR